MRLLRIATAQLADFFEPALRDCGLVENQFNVLCYLLASKSGRLPPSELTDLMGTSRPNTTRILRDMVGLGLIEMHPVEHDGRRSMVSLTPKGRQRVRLAIPVMSQPVAAAFGGLSAKDRTVLNRILRSLIESIDEGDYERRSAA